MRNEDPLEKKNVTVQKAKTITGIYISNVSYLYYDEIKNSLYKEVNNLFYKKKFTGGFLFDGCNFDEALLDKLKIDLQEYQMNREELHFKDCWFWGNNGRMHKSDIFFKEKISDN